MAARTLSFLMLISVLLVLSQGNNDYSSENKTLYGTILELQSKPYGIDIDWHLRLKQDSVTHVVITGYFEVKKPIDKWQGQIDMIWCENGVDASNCIKIYEAHYDGCKSLETKGEWYSHFAQNVTPKLKCPVKPGKYTVHNMSASIFNGPQFIEGRFEFRMSGMDKDGVRRFQYEGTIYYFEEDEQARRENGLE